MEGEWTTGFLDCYSDCGSCILTTYCPCITFGRVAEIVDQGSTSCCAAGSIYMLLNVFLCCGRQYSYHYLKKMRSQYNIRGDDCGDCLKHCFFEPCALTQQYRELKHRGFDMSLGWEGNAAKQQYKSGVAMGALVSQGGMTR